MAIVEITDNNDRVEINYDWTDYQDAVNKWRASTAAHTAMLAAYKKQLEDLDDMPTELAFMLLAYLIQGPLDQKTQQLDGLGHSIEVTGHYRAALSEVQAIYAKYVANPPRKGDHQAEQDMIKFSNALKDIRAKASWDPILDPANKKSITSAVDKIASQWDQPGQSNPFGSGNAPRMIDHWRAKFIDLKDPYAPSLYLTAISNAHMEISTACDAVGTGLNAKVQYTGEQMNQFQGITKSYRDRLQSSTENMIGNLRPR